MNYQDRYNSERYLDMTAYLALRNIEREERRLRMREDWIYRRGDVYLANLDPYIGSEQGGTRPVVVLQNNTGNFYCPTLIIAPITSKGNKKRSLPTHYYAEYIQGLDVPGIVLLEQIKTIDNGAYRNIWAECPGSRWTRSEKPLKRRSAYMSPKKWRLRDEPRIDH